MIHGGALSWSIALHATVAVVVWVFGGEPRERRSLAGISLFNASPLPMMTEGLVSPIVPVPSQWQRSCPASPPRERQPRLSRMAVAAFVQPVGGCIRVGEDGRVDAVGFGAGVPEVDRRRLASLAADLRFAPATRDGLRVPAWLGIAVRRRAPGEPFLPPCDGGCR